MHPLIELSIGSNLIQVHTYALLISVALFIMLLTLIYGLKKCQLTVLRIIMGTVITLVSAVLGARFFYYVLYPPNDLEGFFGIFKLNFFGFTLYGGILGAVLALWYLANRWHFKLFRLMDYMLVGTGLGLVVSRLACWFNGCCYGKVTTMPWGMKMVKGSYAYKAYINENPLNLFSKLPSIHPTQLYEIGVILMALVVGICLLYYKKNGRVKDGTASIWFGLVLTTGRFFVFMVRSFPYATISSNIIRGPVTYGVTLIVLLLFLKRSSRT